MPIRAVAVSSRSCRSPDRLHFDLEIQAEPRAIGGEGGNAEPPGERQAPSISQGKAAYASRRPQLSGVFSISHCESDDPEAESLHVGA